MSAPAGEAPQDGGDRPAAKQRTVEVITLAVVLAFSLLMMWDNWRTGIDWESTGPKPGYFPFYVALICGGAATYGLVREIFFPPDAGEAFVLRHQFKRVMQVFVPTLAFVPAIQLLGLYVASFILITGFMIWIGRLKPWISIVTALVFSVAMFVTFELAFDVIMPKGPLEHLLGY
ncbi:MAG TPA: tripartite tricarboxylate transporter TctB family protein [Usitatibacter sp.]|nr:tripartite tricarboxylate transporter TctB family protein [Usitatibacter sp.]